jgi:hypothetical protein
MLVGHFYIANGAFRIVGLAPAEVFGLKPRLVL